MTPIKMKIVPNARPFAYGSIAAGVSYAKVMGELYRLKVDRTEKGQGQ